MLLYAWFYHNNTLFYFTGTTSATPPTTVRHIGSMVSTRFRIHKDEGRNKERPVILYHLRIGFVICVIFTIGGIIVTQDRTVRRYLSTNLVFLDSISTTSSLSSRQIPLDQYFDSIEVLNSKIQENIHFHQRGGNLKVYQEFLDGAIDTTLQKYETTFIPKSNIMNGETNVQNVTDFLRQYYADHTSPRRGYGEPLPGRFQNAVKSPIFYERRWVDIIEPRESKLKWDVGLGPIGPKCSNLIQLGATNDDGDGGKSMCIPKIENGSNNECHVISIGGNDNWVFEIAMVRMMNCTTYTFDCTLPGGKPKNKPNNDQMKFFNYCISGGGNSPNQSSDDTKYLTYEQASQMAGITVSPMYFKMDVEGFEYDIFTNMLQTTPYDMLPMQIQVELHWNSRMTDLSWLLRNRNVGEILLLTNMMFSIGGYIPIEYDFNPYCPSCMEVLYFRAATPATTATTTMSS